MPLFGKRTSNQETGIRVGDDVREGSIVEHDEIIERTPVNPLDLNVSPDSVSRGFMTISRKGALLWASGIVVLMLWVFVLGVLVGRGTIFQNQVFRDFEERLTGGAAADSNAPVPVVEIAGEKNKQPDSGAATEEQEPELTFYKDLTSTKPRKEKINVKPLKRKIVIPEPKPDEELKPTEVAAKKPTEKPEPAKSAKPAKPAEPVKKPVEKKQEAKPAASEKPEPKPLVVTSGVKTVKEEVSDAPPPKRKSGENFTVQVAAAGSIVEAEKMVKRLINKGFDAYFYQVELKGRKYIRVRVGRYKTFTEAKNCLEKLSTAGYSKMFVSALTD